MPVKRGRANQDSGSKPRQHVQRAQGDKSNPSRPHHATPGKPVVDAGGHILMEADEIKTPSGSQSKEGSEEGK